MKYNILTGAEIKEDSKTPYAVKMCLNCKHHIVNDEDGKEVHRCNNETVMRMGTDKIYGSLPDGFEIETLVLKPMFLKNPTKKCGNYEADFDLIMSLIKSDLEK